jgi:hypothetical protein
MFEVFTPLSPEQYEVLLDLGEGDIIYYTSLAKLIEIEGADVDYTSDFLPVYDEMYAN